MGSQAHGDADESGCAEVVYTTLPVLVEMSAGACRRADLWRFWAKIRRLREINCFRMTNAVVLGDRGALAGRISI
jgi:hypothetical protein